MGCPLHRLRGDYLTSTYTVLLVIAVARLSPGLPESVRE